LLLQFGYHWIFFNKTFAVPFIIVNEKKARIAKWIEACGSNSSSYSSHVCLITAEVFRY
jgi:hypothetical protein